MGGVSRVTYWTAAFIWDFSIQALFVIASCLILKGKTHRDSQIQLSYDFDIQDTAMWHTDLNL